MSKPIARYSTIYYSFQSILRIYKYQLAFCAILAIVARALVPAAFNASSVTFSYFLSSAAYLRSASGLVPSLILYDPLSLPFWV